MSEWSRPVAAERRALEWLSGVLCGHSVLAVSVNRAKGLDQRAVVVTGLPALEEASLEQRSLSRVGHGCV